MIIEQKKCDQCGKVHEFVQKTIEIREVAAMEINQINRAAPTPSYDLADRRLGSKVYALSFYDFCDLACAKAWIEQRLAVPPVITVTD